MKIKTLLLGIITLLNFNLAIYAKHNHGDLKINTKISSVEWIGKKVTGQHSGNISIKEGTLNVHEGKISNGKVIMDMSSITVTDIKPDKGGNKLLGHLNSTDFFDVSNHPITTLDIKNVKVIEGNKHMISGSLTIKGITKPIEFPATIEMKDGNLGAFAEIKVDRTLYNIKYGSGKFFEGLGDKVIDDHFIIKFKIAAN